jgi:hypothetical protein
VPAAAAAAAAAVVGVMVVAAVVAVAAVVVVAAAAMAVVVVDAVVIATYALSWAPQTAESVPEPGAAETRVGLRVGVRGPQRQSTF